MEIARRLYSGPIDVIALVSDPEALAAMRQQLEPLVSPDLETFLDPASIPMGIPMADDEAGAVAKGIDGFIGIFKEWSNAWESWTVTPHDFVAVDDERVLVPMEIKARSRTQGLEITIEGANLITIQNRRLTRVELFFRRETALEAAGLSE